MKTYVGDSPKKQGKTPRVSEFIYYNSTPDIIGSWIYQKCCVDICKNEMTYWSLEGKPKYKYINAKCEVHKNGS